MANVTLNAPKPRVTLDLSWDEFEVLVASHAKGDPRAVLSWLHRNSPGTTTRDLIDLHKITSPLHKTLTDLIEKVK